LRDPTLKNPITRKKSSGVAQGIGPEIKPQHTQKKKIIFKKNILKVQFCQSSLRTHSPKKIKTAAVNYQATASSLGWLAL
jgi:hypothetical protein